VIIGHILPNISSRIDQDDYNSLHTHPEFIRLLLSIGELFESLEVTDDDDTSCIKIYTYEGSPAFGFEEPFDTLIVVDEYVSPLYISCYLNDMDIYDYDMRLIIKYLLAVANDVKSSPGAKITDVKTLAFNQLYSKLESSKLSDALLIDDEFIVIANVFAEWVYEILKTLPINYWRSGYIVSYAEDSTDGGIFYMRTHLNECSDIASPTNAVLNINYE
jgi:hypothetical protein